YGTRVAMLDGWRYCPRCAAELRRDGSWVDCDACGFSHLASSATGVGAFVLDEDGRLLLARRAFEPDEGKWDNPGGFLDEGEEPIDGLRRELREEAGVEIHVGSFVGGFVDTYGEPPNERHVLNLVWEARVAEGDPTPSDDVSELRWFAKDELPAETELAFRWLGPALTSWARSR
ncbi:MAG: NUDIX hydrolase, partial [Gemmatimonadota bacterium]